MRGLRRLLAQVPQPNLVDRVITYLDPVRALRRRQARMVLALTGGYTGARRDRHSMREWRTTGGDADTDLLPDLPTLRERSRDLARNAPMAAGALNTKVTSIIGPGLKPHPRLDREILGVDEDQADQWERLVVREWRLWSATAECDVTRTSTFAELQALAFRSMLENGDVFALLPYVERPPSPYGLRVQLIEADRVCNPNFNADTDKIAGGIERDEYGAPTAYHILDQHPGAIYGGKGAWNWRRIPAFGERSGRRNVLHLYRQRRPGQSRGIPDLAPVIETLKQLTDYTEAEVKAAVVASLFTVFTKTETGTGLSGVLDAASGSGSSSTTSSSDEDEIKLGSGAIVDLAAGEDISIANPGRPNQAFEQFVTAAARVIGMALELPLEILLKHFMSSYSAARGAMLEAWRYFLSERASFSGDFCVPIYEAFFTEAVARGRISAPGFLNGDPLIREAYLRSEWTGPPRGQIDELKEITASERRVDMGISTLDEETSALTGGDWEAKHRQRAKEVRMRRQDGLEEGEAPAPANSRERARRLLEQDRDE